MDILKLFLDFSANKYNKLLFHFVSVNQNINPSEWETTTKHRKRL